MSAPVIDPESSVLIYPQWLNWEHQFSATGTPYDWTIASGGFPSGMTFQPSLSVTGTSSDNAIAASNHGLPEGAGLVFRSKTGGSSLTTNTIYYLVNAATDSFQLAATPGGSALALGTNITAALLYRPGFLSGAATVPGVSDVRLKAINTDAPSAEVLFPIGIVAAAAVPDSNADFVWDFATNNIIAQTSSVLNLTPADRNTPILFVKEQDDLIIRLRLVKNTSVLDLAIADGDAKLVLKELEPEGKIVVSDASIKAGTGDASSVLIHAKIDGSAIKVAFTNYEDDGGTQFAALAEIQISFDNPGYFGGDPAKLTRTSKTFRIQTERDLSEN
jgi:hypothetical protein